jgi:hypothetical protein
VRLAGLAHFYHWPRAELLALTMPEIAMWEAAAVEFLEEAKAQAG